MFPAIFPVVFFTPPVASATLVIGKEICGCSSSAADLFMKLGICGFDKEPRDAAVNQANGDKPPPVGLSGDRHHRPPIRKPRGRKVLHQVNFTETWSVWRWCVCGGQNKSGRVGQPVPLSLCTAGFMSLQEHISTSDSEGPSRVLLRASGAPGLLGGCRLALMNTCG